MGRKKKIWPIIKNLEVKDLGAEGKAIGRFDEKVVFITGVVPGDIVDVQILRKRKSYLEGIPVHFHEFSEDRANPFCEHFGLCGGCKWQNLPYEKQLFYKQKQVFDQLIRIGKLDKTVLSLGEPILASPQTKNYRNKLEFTFSNKRWLTNEELASEDTFKERKALGFHLSGKFDKVLDIQHCYLQQAPSDKIRAWIREYSNNEKFRYFDLRAHTGFLRNLIIRTTQTGELMVIISFFEDDVYLREKLLSDLLFAFPEISSLMYVINTKVNDTILDQEILSFHGKDHIIEKMENLSFKVGPKSFYQTNSEQALQLYKKVREFACLSGKETVYDLYTGTGTIACFIAAQAGKVIGLESVPEAIEDAWENARMNQLGNVYFKSGYIKDTLTPELIKEHGHPDVLILDPPRVGMHQKVVQTILDTLPEKIVYVSCNPATQARDILLLSDRYSVGRIQPVDMFPQTHHVENVVMLTLNQK